MISPIWETPWYKTGHSFAAEALGGWSFVGVFTARTGVPFTVYDYTLSKSATLPPGYCFRVPELSRQLQSSGRRRE